MRRHGSILLFAAALGACQLHQDLGTADGATSPDAATADSAARDAAPAVDATTGVDAVPPATDARPGTDATAHADVGSDADARPVVDGGSCADAALVPGTTRPYFDEAVRICGMYAVCVADGTTFAGCVQLLANGWTAAEYPTAWTGGPVTFVDSNTFPTPIEFAQAEPSVRACLAAATTCDAMFQCENAGAPSTTCTPAVFGAPIATCDGTVLRSCLYASDALAASAITGGPARPREFAFDCALQGTACVAEGNTGMVGSPMGAGCAAATCDVTSFTPTCAGGTATNCELGFQASTRCPTGTACAIGSDGLRPQAQCVPTGPACDAATFVPRCDCDGELVGCYDGHEGRTTCPFGACRVGGSGAAACVDGTACDANSVACDAASGRITICSEGRVGAVDCRALGYSGCGAGRFSSGVFCQ